MKKLLGILVLSLLWCGNLYAVSQDDIINQHLKNRSIQDHNAKFKSKEDIENEDKKLAKIINDAKKTCKVLGFNENSEKFADCTLKLYSQEIDNKVALEVAKQKSSSSSSNSGTMVIYDPVRDRQNKIDKGMEMITGRCTLGTDC